MSEKIREILIEPMTRIEGHLGIHAEADVEARKYVEAHSFGTMFRGFELILKGREPADAIWITPRICGVCPTPHTVASTEAVEMAYAAPPPPLGMALRNLVYESEQLYDAVLGCMILEGPDYSQSIVEKLNPDWWKEARASKAEGADLHGFSKVSDIMEALNPLSGQLWLRALELEKLGGKMTALFGGKHPHVQTYVPGGIAKTVTATDLEMFAGMLSKHIAFTKEFVPVFDDLLNFLVEMGYEEGGARAPNMVSYGGYEDVEAYDAKYENMSGWAEKRKVTPGIVINGELITTDLVEINVGVREYVQHSYYDEWEGPEVRMDPLMNMLVREHPWNKETVPRPGPAKAWSGKYSWCAAPRWHDWKNRLDGGIHVVEAGPISRMWATAKGGKVPESTGTSLQFALPRAAVVGFRVQDETGLEWKVPAKPNTLERIRARAYFHAYSAHVAYGELLGALELVKGGKAEVWKKYDRPRDGLGVGMTEAMRGAVGHWLVMRNGRIHRYQVITPSTWNVSPRGPEGRPGPYEESIIGTPVTEATPPEQWNGLDAVRAVRSCDPCLACSIAVYIGDRVVKRDIDQRIRLK